VAYVRLRCSADRKTFVGRVSFALQLQDNTGLQPLTRKSLDFFRGWSAAGSVKPFTSAEFDFA
jgi:hypothetical protein